MKFNIHWKIIVIASLFNVLAEYSLRGVNNLLQNPLILPAIFLNYFFYFACLEYLIVKYKLRDVVVGAVGLFFGFLWMVLGPSVAYIAPQFLGVNWINAALVNFVWWVPIQTVLALYLARRVIPGDRQEPFLTPGKFKQMFYLFCIVTIAFSIVLPFFPLAPLGRIVLLVITLLVGRYAKGIVLHNQQSEASKPQKSSSVFLDGILVFLVVFFVYSSIVLTKEALFQHSSFMNMDAIRVGFRMHTALALALYAYRFIFKKEIPV